MKTQIKPYLWNAIDDSYTSGNYTHAIRDAMSVLTQVLRDKSGLDGDGDKLVGQALGFGPGKRPRIKVNKLQTETEQGVQKGLMLVLKGMYALVRNPRSHEKLEDDKQTADRIVLFIDYLLDFLGRSQQSFTVQGFLDMVADPFFVADPEYVTGLVDAIPVRKQGDSLIALYRAKSAKLASNFELVIRELVSRATETAIDDLISVVSEDLQMIDGAGPVALVIKVLPAELWPQIDRIPRLRVETMLLDQLQSAWYTPHSDHTNSPASTWIPYIAEHYLRKNQLRAVIISRLRAEDFDAHNIVARFFFQSSVLPKVFEEEDQISACVSAICDSLRSGNEFVKDCLLGWVAATPPEEWREEFISNLGDLTDPDNPEIYLADGTPLLGGFVSLPNPVGEDDIPF